MSVNHRGKHYNAKKNAHPENEVQTLLFKDIQNVFILLCKLEKYSQRCSIIIVFPYTKATRFQMSDLL